MSVVGVSELSGVVDPPVLPLDTVGDATGKDSDVACTVTNGELTELGAEGAFVAVPSQLAINRVLMITTILIVAPWIILKQDEAQE